MELAGRKVKVPSIGSVSSDLGLAAVLVPRNFTLKLEGNQELALIFEFLNPFHKGVRYRYDLYIYIYIYNIRFFMQRCASQHSKTSHDASRWIKMHFA